MSKKKDTEELHCTAYSNGNKMPNEDTCAIKKTTNEDIIKQLKGISTYLSGKFDYISNSLYDIGKIQHDQTPIIEGLSVMIDSQTKCIQNNAENISNKIDVQHLQLSQLIERIYYQTECIQNNTENIEKVATVLTKFKQSLEFNNKAMGFAIASSATTLIIIFLHIIGVMAL